MVKHRPPNRANAEVARLVNVALAAHGAGRFEEAVAAYREILRHRTDMSAVYANLADALVQLGSLSEAEQAYRQALARQPAATTFSNLGSVLLQGGRAAEAETAFRQAIRLDPSIADYHANLAAALLQRGEHAEAVAAYGEAIARAPADARAHYGLGCALVAQGRRASAVEAFHRAVAARPDWPDALVGLANQLTALRRGAEAIPHYLQADALEPGRADVLAALGQVLARSGPVGALPAQAAFRAALACHPLPTRIHASVAAGLHESGDTAEAVAAFRNLIETHPEDPHGWSGLAKVVADGGGSDWGLSPDLLATMLEHPCVRPSALRRATLASLKADAGLAALVAAAERGERLEPAGEIATLLSGHRLLLTALPALPLCDVGFERLFTALRRGLVLGGLPAAALPFAVALAAQCQLVDYVWEEGADETAVGAAAGIVLLAAYRPLVTVAGVEKMAGIAEVFDLHVAQPLEERRLAAAMPRLTGRANAVSEGVRAQYEEFPYPRWRRPGLEPEKRSLDEIWGAIPAHPAPPQLDRPLEVLIAGCGTGQHALNSASIYGDARVLAVDISLASLAYAQRQTRALGVEGIEYAQADILELGGLERRFDVIECAGVLHHLADPLAGWRVLRRLVRDDGLMRIALYSRAARQAVAACRAFIAERGYKADLDGIRRCRQDILALPDGHPARPVIAFPDFHGANECRDLLFHVQEHTFTLPAIEAALAELNLCFLGLAAPAATRAFRAEFGDAADPLSLAAWHAFETEHPDAFVGMYDFWVAPAGGQP